MISKMEDGTVFLRMGEGTLYSSVVKSNGQPIGICFSNSKEKLQDAVVFQITSMEGLAGFTRPLINLFEEWNTDNNEDVANEIDEFRDFLKPFFPTLNATKTVERGT